MQNAKVQGNTKLCIFAFNFSPVHNLTKRKTRLREYYLESKLFLGK